MSLVSLCRPAFSAFLVVLRYQHLYSETSTCMTLGSSLSQMWCYGMFFGSALLSILFRKSTAATTASPQNSLGIFWSWVLYEPYLARFVLYFLRLYSAGQWTHVRWHIVCDEYWENSETLQWSLSYCRQKIIFSGVSSVYLSEIAKYRWTVTKTSDISLMKYTSTLKDALSTNVTEYRAPTFERTWKRPQTSVCTAYRTPILFRFTAEDFGISHLLIFSCMQFLHCSLETDLLRETKPWTVPFVIKTIVL